MPGTEHAGSTTIPLAANHGMARSLALEKPFRQDDVTVEIELHRAAVNYPIVITVADIDSEYNLERWIELHKHCLEDSKLGQAAWDDILALASQHSMTWTNAFIQSLTYLDLARKKITINQSRLKTLLLLKRSYGLKSSDLSKSIVSPYSEDTENPDHRLLLALERSSKFIANGSYRRLSILRATTVLVPMSDPVSIDRGTIVIQGAQDEDSANINVYWSAGRISCNRVLMLDENDVVPEYIDQRTIYIQAIQDQPGTVRVYWSDNEKNIEKILENTASLNGFLEELRAAGGNTTSAHLCQKITLISGYTCVTKRSFERLDFLQKITDCRKSNAANTKLREKITAITGYTFNEEETFNSVILDQMGVFLQKLDEDSIKWLTQHIKDNLLTFSMLYSLCFEQQESDKEPGNHELIIWLIEWIQMCNGVKAVSDNPNLNPYLISFKHIIKYGFSPTILKKTRDGTNTLQVALQLQVKLDKELEEKFVASATSLVNDSQYGYRSQLTVPPDELLDNIIYLHLGNADHEDEFLQYTVKNLQGDSVTRVLTPDDLSPRIYASIIDKIHSLDHAEPLTAEERCAVMTVSSSYKHTPSYSDDAENRYVLLRLLEILGDDRLEFYHQHHRLTALINLVKESKISLIDVQKYDEFHSHESPPRRLPRLLAGYRDDRAPPLTVGDIVAYDLYDFDPKTIPTRAINCRQVLILNENDAVSETIDIGTICLQKIQGQPDEIRAYWSDGRKIIEKILEDTVSINGFLEELRTDGGNSTNPQLCQRITSISGYSPRATLKNKYENTTGANRTDKENTLAQSSFARMKAGHAAADEYLDNHFNTVMKPIVTKRAQLFLEMQALMSTIEKNKSLEKKHSYLDTLYYLFHRTPSQELALIRDKIALFSGALTMMTYEYNRIMHDINIIRGDGNSPEPRIDRLRDRNSSGIDYFMSYQAQYKLRPRQLFADKKYLYESLGSVSFVDDRVNLVSGPGPKGEYINTVLNEARNSVRGFFKALLGCIIIAPVTGFTAFASSSFRETFLCSQSSNCFTKAQKQEDILLAKLHAEFVNPSMSATA